MIVSGILSVALEGILGRALCTSCIESWLSGPSWFTVLSKSSADFTASNFRWYLSFPVLLSPLVTSDLLSRWICLFWTFPVRGTRQWVAFCVCLLLLVVKGSSMLQQASELHSFSLLTN